MTASATGNANSHAEFDHTLIRSVRASTVKVAVDADLQAYGNDTVDVVLVVVEDQDGRTGTGFTYTFGPGGLAVRSMVNDVLAPLVRGTSLAEWHTTHSELARRTRRIGRSVFTPAISAIDIAVWDLRGIVADVPLFRLLGGTPEQKPIYGSGRSANALSLDDLVSATESYLSEGYTAVKLRVGARSPEEDAARLRAVRHAVGDGIRLMVDCNERMDLASAMWLADRAAELGVYWVEEPLPAEQIKAYTVLARRSRVALAAGEHLAGCAEFAHYAEENAVAIFQPDVALCGGITEGLRIRDLAAAYGIPVSFHSLPELHIHLAAGNSNAVYVEHFPVIDKLLAEPLKQRDGHVAPPGRPGHGLTWDPEAIAAHTVAR